MKLTRCTQVGRSQTLCWYGVVVLILLFAVALRFSGGLDWDEGTHTHPDERHLTQVATAIQWPTDLRLYFNTSESPLNPRNVGFHSFVYGLWPVTLTKFCAQLLGMHSFWEIHWVGRGLAAMADLGTMIATAIMAGALFGTGSAVIALFLSAFTVLQIQHAHFFVVDPFLTFSTTLALLLVLRCATPSPSPRHTLSAFLLSGLGIGVAISCKLSVLPLLGLLFLVAILGCRATSMQVCLGRACASVLAMLCAALVFRVLQPYVFVEGTLMTLDPRFMADMSQLFRLSSGPSSFPPSLQWIDRPWWFGLEQAAMWGLGIPASVLLVLGIGLSLSESSPNRRTHRILLLAFAAILVIAHALSFVKPLRYLLPLYPIGVVFASYGALRLLSLGAGSHFTRQASVAFTAVLLVCHGLWGIAFASIYSRSFVRADATRWMYQHIPQGSRIAIEHWDDPLPAPLSHSDSSSRPVTYPTETLEVFARYSWQKKRTLASRLMNTEYLILNSARGYGSIPRDPQHFPATIRLYQALFSGELGFSLVQRFRSSPRLFGISIPTYLADESLWVYDHPIVLIFKKTSDLSKEALLGFMSTKTTVRDRNPNAFRNLSVVIPQVAVPLGQTEDLLRSSGGPRSSTRDIEQPEKQAR